MEQAAKKTLGVLGGMGPQATALFYERVIARTAADRDQEHIPMLILSHSTMPDRTEMLLGGRAEELHELLLKDARFLQRSGAGVLAIPCNTSHFFADRLQAELSIPLVNMVEETARAAAAQGVTRAGILATDGTVQNGMYQAACARHGIDAVLPGGENQKRTMHIIYSEIKRGLPGSPAVFAEIDRELKARGCDGVILACTELSCFRAQERLGEGYIDALEVLAERSILACGGLLKDVTR
jgi:aspartate racemase